MDCSSWVNGELRPENVCPTGEDPDTFTRTQWTPHQTWFLVYRVAIAIFLIGWIIFDYLKETLVFYAPQYGFWFVYATDLGFIMLAITAVVQAVVTLMAHFGRPATDNTHLDDCDASIEADPRPIPLKTKIFWILYEISGNNAFVISFSFWTFIITMDHNEAMFATSSKLKHSLNSVYVLADLLISGVPIRLFHVIYPIITQAVYVIFTVIYYELGGRGPGGHSGIYPTLTWQSPAEATVTVGLEVLLSVTMQCVLYSVYKLRLRLQTKDRGRGCCSCCRGEATGETEDSTGETHELVQSQSRDSGYKSTGTFEQDTLPTSNGDISQALRADRTD